MMAFTYTISYTIERIEGINEKIGQKCPIFSILLVDLRGFEPLTF